MTVIGPKRRFAASQRYVRSPGVKQTCQDSPTDAIDPSEARCLGPRRAEVREERTGSRRIQLAKKQ